MSTVVPSSFVGVDSYDKMRFGFTAGSPSLLLWETELGGGGDVLPFDFCSALNWDCGLVNCGPNILRGYLLFFQHEIQVYCLRAFVIGVGTEIGGKGYVFPFDLIAHH